MAPIGLTQTTQGFRFTDLDQLAMAGVDRKALSVRLSNRVPLWGLGYRIRVSQHWQSRVGGSGGFIDFLMWKLENSQALEA